MILTLIILMNIIHNHSMTDNNMCMTDNKPYPFFIYYIFDKRITAMFPLYCFVFWES